MRPRRLAHLGKRDQAVTGDHRIAKADIFSSPPKPTMDAPKRSAHFCEK
ncbi:MAG: hypothetical protein U0892_12605 [Pirellulales bacterium]